MTMMANKSIFALLVLALAAPLWAEPAGDLVALSARDGFDVALAFKKNGCHTRTVHSGKTDKMEFVEGSADCDSFSVDFEITSPLVGRERESYINHELLLVTESYSVGRNPYAGYISSDVQCPSKLNLFKDNFIFNGRRRPMVVARTNSRHVWGACGKSSVDQWGALAFLDQTQAFGKLKFASKARLDREKFKAEVEKFMRDLKAMSAAPAQETRR